MIQEQMGGSFARDPLMGAMLSFSEGAAPEAKEYFVPVAEQSLQTNRDLTAAMFSMGGIKRFGTLEEQERAIDRKLRKKRHKETNVVRR